MWANFWPPRLLLRRAGLVMLVCLLTFVTAEDGPLHIDVAQNCTGSDCSSELDEDRCPPDATFDVIDLVCICKDDHCFQPLCKTPGQSPMLRRKASGRPGDCCDIYECAAPHEPDCSEVICPDDSAKCPDDSYRLPAHLSLHDCCPTPLQCQCYPRKCPEAICALGERPLVVRKGNGEPGTCCDVFHCIQPNRTCSVGTAVMKNGISWLNDIGSNCTCINGLVHCNDHADDPGGCQSVDGVFYQNGETWEEDFCSTCTCSRGKKKCQAFICASCEHPVPIPGECCPRCDDNLKSTPPTSNCKPDETLNCSLTCQYGFAKDASGCQTCACRPGPPKSDKSCTASSGSTRVDGEVWVDGCRQCFCQGGTEMCSLVICPKLKCSKPIFHHALDCCATCPDGSSNHTVPPKVALCYSLDGTYKSEGDTWMMEPCTPCICHQGQALCETRQCPPTPCLSPELAPGQCCPYCPLKDSIPANGTPCSPVHAHSSTWRQGPCESCICIDGKMLCFTQQCEANDCTHPVLAKGQCCATCIGRNTGLDLRCHVANLTFSSGESWLSMDCMQCVCHSGEKNCSPLDCPTLCRSKPNASSHCCPPCITGTSWSESSGSNSKAVYLVIVGVVGILIGILGVVAASYVKQYLRTRHYSVSICPESGCNEAFTSLAKTKYKVGSKSAADTTEKAKLTSV